MHALLGLAEILYFPSDGRGEGLVAEELLDWLNTVDRGELLLFRTSGPTPPY